MKVELDLQSPEVKEFGLSLIEYLVLNIVRDLDTHDPKIVNNELLLFKMKDDSIYRVIKRLESKGVLRYQNEIGRHLYLISDVDENYLKVGRSNDANKRLKGVQTNSVHELKLISIINDKGYLEREIHFKFKSLNKIGEWFEYDDSIINHFKKLYNEQPY